MYRLTALLALSGTLSLAACAGRTIPPPAEIEQAVASDCGYVYSDTVALYCRRIGGGGQPVVLLHGFGSSSESWRDVEGPLAAGRTLFMPDLKGFGRSSKPDDGAYTPDEQARILAAFIEHLDVPGAVLLGHSYGGGVALLTYDLLRARSATTIRALVLIDAAVYDQELPGFIRLLRTPIVNRLALGVTSGFFQAQTILRQSFKHPEAVTRERVERHAQFLDTPGAHEALVATAQQIDDLPPGSIEAIVERVSVPTLVVWGDSDPLVPLTSGRRLSRAIPGAQLEVIADCGHVPHEECPGTTIEAMLSFLGNLPL